MSLNLSEKQIYDSFNRTLQRIQAEEKYRLIKEIPNFPFSSVNEIQSLVKQGKLYLTVFSDVDLTSKFGNANCKSLKKRITIFQNIVHLVLVLTPILLTIKFSNYWMLLCIPLTFVGSFTTTPTPRRQFYLLLAFGLLFSFFFIDNQFFKYSALIFSLANIFNNFLRFIDEATVLNIIYKNEEAFVWGFYKKAFLIRVVETGDTLIPGLPEDLEEINFNKVRSTIYKN